MAINFDKGGKVLLKKLEGKIFPINGRKTIGYVYEYRKINSR